MLSKSSKRVLTGTAILTVSVYLIYRYWYYPVGILFSLIVGIMNIGRSLEPTDKQMIEHFRQNEKSFDRLLRLSSFLVMDSTLDKHYPLHSMSERQKSFRSFLENNPLYYYNLLPARKENDDIRFLSPVDREKESKHLMKKLKIRSCSRLNPYYRNNSVDFVYFHEGGPFKGYEYVYDRTEEDKSKIFIETEEDISDLRRKRSEEIHTLYKKIDDNWNLYVTK